MFVDVELSIRKILDGIAQKIKKESWRTPTYICGFLNIFPKLHYERFQTFKLNFHIKISLLAVDILKRQLHCIFYSFASLPFLLYPYQSLVEYTHGYIPNLSK